VSSWRLVGNDVIVFRTLEHRKPISILFLDLKLGDVYGIPKAKGLDAQKLFFGSKKTLEGH